MREHLIQFINENDCTEEMVRDVGEVWPAEDYADWCILQNVFPKGFSSTSSSSPSVASSPVTAGPLFEAET